MPRPSIGTKARQLTLKARFVAASGVFAERADDQQKQREAGDFDEELQAARAAVAQEPPKQRPRRNAGRSRAVALPEARQHEQSRVDGNPPPERDTVAQAAPSIPSEGSPKWPKIQP